MLNRTGSGVDDLGDDAEREPEEVVEADVADDLAEAEEFSLVAELFDEEEAELDRRASRRGGVLFAR
jgi:chromatin segregation and condensation protein Rec8/ScpA/Scc1 (kleisin family)